MSEQDQERFSIGYTLGELSHRLAALEQKLQGWETKAKRIGILIILGTSTAITHIYPSQGAKLLLSAFQQLLSAFSP